MSAPAAPRRMRSPRRMLHLALLSAVALQALALAAQLLLELRLLDTPAARDGGLAALLAAVLGVAAFPAVGLVILRRRPEHPVGWLFCVVMLGFTVANACGAYVRLAAVAYGGLPAREAMAWAYAWSGRLSAAGFVLFLLVFPDGRFLSRRWRGVGKGAVAVIVLTALAAAFAPGPVDRMIGVNIDNPLGIGGPVGAVLRVVAEAGWPASVALMVLAVLCLVQRHRRSRGLERQQLKWFVAGVVLWALWLPAFVAGALLHAPAGAWPLWARAAALGAIGGVAALPVTAAVAILRYRLYDIDRIVSRTVAYGVVTAVLVGTYGGVVVALGPVLGRGSDLAVAAATLAAAAVFRPARRRVQARVDRRFDRARYDARRTVAAFASRLRDEVRAEQLTRDLVGVASAALQPARASVWLRGEQR